MKTLKWFGYVTACVLALAVSSCTTYYSRPNYSYGRPYGYHRHHAPPPPPRPYGGNYGYGRPGW
ncbi:MULTISPECIES: hypothetical protein [unclassified Spirosoma]|uniref:hypothetical protein n=1 Tax=unclassified Spirosoma TaxID=2621999 RepID=UPI001ACCFD7D|nr:MULTISPECIES: hypothetical protein [unclassified Spirosoma]MBN8822796.1 hypothetical protein [Spirosoma sp.]